MNRGWPAPPIHSKSAALGGGQDGAGLLQAAQGRVMVDAVAGADRVHGHEHAEVLGQQIEGRVQDADVRFDAGQHDLGPGLAVQASRRRPGRHRN